MTSPLTKVYIVSDALGGTAERVFRAAIVQFTDEAMVAVERVTYVRTKEAVDRVVASAANEAGAMIVYSLVRETLGEYLWTTAQVRGIPIVDVLGPMIQGLSHVFGRAPQEVAGLTHRADGNYFQRVEAAEFAVRYDDGKDPSALLAAEVVLLGVSRTSKTPLSLYLANRRLKVANVPLAPELPLPASLSAAAHKVVGLTIAPEALLSIRKKRVGSLGLGESAGYASWPRIIEELAYARGVFDRVGCPVVDVSHQAVEETAEHVLTLLKRRRQNPTG